MGIYLSQANKDKSTSEGIFNKGTFGTCSMQGS